jgi:hypothetical protein
MVNVKTQGFKAKEAQVSPEKDDLEMRNRRGWNDTE